MKIGRPHSQPSLKLNSCPPISMPSSDTSPRSYLPQKSSRYLLAYYVKSLYICVQKHCTQIGLFPYPPMYIVRQKYIIFASILVDLFPCKIVSNPHGFPPLFHKEVLISHASMRSRTTVFCKLSLR